MPGRAPARASGRRSPARRPAWPRRRARPRRAPAPRRRPPGRSSAATPRRGTLTWTVDGVAYPAGAAAAARAALAPLVAHGGFAAGPACGAPLYQAAPAPRRVPLALYIARHARRRFEAVWLDEVHEFNTAGSAQERAAHLLAGLPGVAVLALTGSLMGGYSSSLFANFWALCPAFRAAFPRDARGAFVQRFGYLKVLRLLPEAAAAGGVQAYGKQSLRAELAADPLIRTLGEAPGVLPLFLPTYLLPHAAVIHKADLEAELPPLREQPVALVPAPDDAAGAALLTAYGALRDALLGAIAADRFTARQGRLLGALAELPGFLDLAAADVGNGVDARGTPVYAIRYADGGALVATAPLLPAATILPKERWLLEQVAAQLARGRPVLVFLRHTGAGRLVPRLQRLLRAACGVEAAYLDPGRVATASREAWLRAEVIGRRRRVLLVNPEAVKTGLNCLTPYFQTAIWLELTYNALTYRQANGRIHRIGADPAAPIEVYVPVYAGTVQEVALGLLARKVSVSTQMDGLDLAGGLEAAGAGAPEADGLSALAVLGLGAALYDILAGRAAAAAPLVPVPAPARPAPPPAARPAPRPAPAPVGDGRRYQQAALFGDDAA